MEKRVSLKKFLLVLGLIVAIVLAGYVGYLIAISSKPTTATIKIGVLGVMSGPNALLGEECNRGWEVAREEINAKGGIKSLGGALIEFVYGDAGADPKRAATEVERLIEVHHVPIILGVYGSSLSFSASEVAERDKTIFWDTICISDPLVQRGYKYYFNTATLIGQPGGFVDTYIDFMDKILKPVVGNRVAIVHEDGLYGTTIYNTYMERLKGYEIIAKESYPYATTTDFSSVISKLKALQPDILIACSYVSDAILFVRQAKQLGFNVKAWLGQGAGYGVPAFAESLGNVVNGIINMEYANWDLKSAQHFVDLYVAKYGHKPMAHAIIAYSGATALWQVLEKAGSLNPDKIKETAENIEIDELACGFGVKFDPTTHANIRAKAYLVEYFNTTLRTIWPKDVATIEPMIPKPEW